MLDLELRGGALGADQMVTSTCSKCSRFSFKSGKRHNTLIGVVYVIREHQIWSIVGEDSVFVLLLALPSQ